MLFGTLGASLLGNTLAGKGMNREEQVRGTEQEKDLSKLVMNLQSSIRIFDTTLSFN